VKPTAAIIATFTALSILAAPQSASAARDTTTAERVVYDQAAWHLRSIGVNVPAFTVSVYSAEETPCGPRSSLAYACAEDGKVFLSEIAAEETRRYYRSARHAKRSVRAVSLSRCGDVCTDSASAAIHELVHVARFAVRPRDSWVATDMPYEEGLAEAIAQDQTAPMIYRVSGLRGHNPAAMVYETWVEMVYAVTDGEVSGRRNRLNAISDPAVAFSMSPTPGVTHSLAK
jgi:hypothetical protein